MEASCGGEVVHQDAAAAAACWAPALAGTAPDLPYGNTAAAAVAAACHSRHLDQGMHQQGVHCRERGVGVLVERHTIV